MEEQIFLIESKQEHDPHAMHKMIGFSIGTLLLLALIGFYIWLFICSPYHGDINNSTNYTTNLCI